MSAENQPYTLVYVLNGLLNGERGVYAVTTLNTKMLDGHYYLLPDEVDPEEGPFASIDDARESALARIRENDRVQTWAFPMDFNDSGKPYRLDDDASTELADCNIATIERNDHPSSTHFRCTLEGSYEKLDLVISVPDHESAALVYSELLRASSKYQ